MSENIWYWAILEQPLIGGGTTIWGDDTAYFAEEDARDKAENFWWNEMDDEEKEQAIRCAIYKTEQEYCDTIDWNTAKLVYDYKKAE